MADGTRMCSGWGCTNDSPSTNPKRPRYCESCRTVPRCPRCGTPTAYRGAGQIRMCDDCQLERLRERQVSYRGRYRARQDAWRRSRGPEYQRRLHLKKYGLTPETFDTLLANQAGCCAVCRTNNPGLNRNGEQAWRIDHNHSCCPVGKSCGECVRGLLCHNCNVAAGHLQDDPSIVRALADYLERTPVHFGRPTT